MTTSRLFLFFVLLLFSLPSWMQAQTSISGLVVTAEDQQSIPDATVYINGTSIKTVTNAEGVFYIRNVVPPVQLVVSHLGYHIETLPIRGDEEALLTIALKAKDVVISKVEVENGDHKKLNMKRFREGFLGADYWGEKAILRNEEVLLFSKSFDKEDIFESESITQRSLSVTTDAPVIPEENEFRVTANSMLEIELPKLGYTLYVDLVYYSERVVEKSKRTSSVGYYYYQPYELNHSGRSRKIKDNRQQAYYFSVQHFCRALYSGVLEEQGYRLFAYNTHKRKFAIDTCVFPFSPSLATVKGLEGKRFLIMYYSDSDGLPLDLTLFKGNVMGPEVGRRSSKVYFMNDSCVFTKDGIIPGNGILFDGLISDKRAGAALPKYYAIDSPE